MYVARRAIALPAHHVLVERLLEEADWGATMRIRAGGDVIRRRRREHAAEMVGVAVSEDARP